MRYHALACDYDGTLAHGGAVDDATVAALTRLRRSGRRIVLVTGRELEDVLRAFPHADLCDRIVAENGAVIYAPSTREARVLAGAPNAAFVEALRARGVAPLGVGRAIVATREPHERTVIEVIRELGLELQVIFNKGAVMVLPSGVNKATGLATALDELRLSPHNVAGVGDAENDHAFLRMSECAVAVANAVPTVKAQADLVTRGERGAGVVELIDALVTSDLAELAPRLSRHEVLLGRRERGGEHGGSGGNGAGETEVRLPAYGINVLLAGTSGSGKSTLATGFLERLTGAGYQVCVIDPEGDYDSFEPAIQLGGTERAPLVHEVTDVISRPGRNCVVNLLGVGLGDRPEFFERLFTALDDLRARTGRPHWIALDEAHHLLPMDWAAAGLTLPEQPSGLLLITVHPEGLAREVLATVDVVLAVGANPGETLRAFSEALGEAAPAEAAPAEAAPADAAPADAAAARGELAPGEALVWWRSRGAPFVLASEPPTAERRRHIRKYAEGELGEDKSFYFRGPDSRLNLRAQNLSLFVQVGDGVDDATWLYHLRRGDYARWLRESIKDPPLAAEAERIAADAGLSAAQSRARLREAIERRYTAA
ncbi:MAG TPA: HAD-IIB family hydrolase [Gemmatimonadales bacterium]|nr:HAD-IIB family hydrolase [Gemmatimonadales bacterium]